MADDTRTHDPDEPLEVGVARFGGTDGAERAYADARDRDATIVVVSTPERVAAMARALAGAAESVQRHPLGPARQARLRSALAERASSP